MRRGVECRINLERNGFNVIRHVDDRGDRVSLMNDIPSGCVDMTPAEARALGALLLELGREGGHA